MSRPGAPSFAQGTRATAKWAVYHVNDDGRRLVSRWCRSQTEAEIVAGRMRDRMTDAEVGAGWNYIADRTRRGLEAGGTRTGGQ